MSRCSDPTYEPGPVTALDLGGFDGTLEPPFATPIARSFADRTGPWLATLDAAYVALEAESVLDISSDVIGAIGDVGTASQASINQEALAHLTTAENGFIAARDSVGELKSWLPPDVMSSQSVTLLDFIVTAAGGARIAGATVTIDADYGRGLAFVTQADGIALIEVAPGVTVGWTVTAAGHAPVTGVSTSPPLGTAAPFLAVRVTLL